MPKWTVNVPYTAVYTVRGVEAEDTESAIESVDSAPNLCHYCSRELDLSDANWDDAEAEDED